MDLVGWLVFILNPDFLDSSEWPGAAGVGGSRLCRAKGLDKVSSFIG